MRKFIYVAVAVIVCLLITSEVMAFSTLPSLWPVTGVITSDFGYRRSPLHPSSRHPHRFHEGVDIAAPRGTPIFASADGRVGFAGYQRGYGRMIVIDHGAGISSVYGHASKLLVRKGCWVQRGAVIARVGSTGNATGPHLHYEVRVGGVPFNPLRYTVQVT